VRVTPDLQILGTVPVKTDVDVSREPDIAFGTDNYLVVWSDGTFGGEHKVQAARVTTDGVVLDSGIVFGMDAYCEYRPSVAFDGQRFLAIWYNYNNTPAGLFGRFINTDAQPEGHELPIRVLTQGDLLDPDIAFKDSNYLAVWQEPSPAYDEDVYGQLISSTGEMLGDMIPIAVDSPYQFEPRVCAGDSNFLVVWNQDYAIYGQWVSTNGELIDTNFLVSDKISRTRDYPAMAFGRDRFIVVWQEYCEDNYDIVGNLDIAPGIQEQLVIDHGPGDLMTTIIAHPLYLPEGSNYRVFDISGRIVDPLRIGPGVYFIACNNKIVRKVVKIR
jgi:hypothetical protein